MNRLRHFPESFYLLFACLILIFTFGIRLINLGQHSLWIDEVLTFNTVTMATDGTTDFVTAMTNRLNHVPLYFALVSLSPGTHTDFSLRFYSILTGLLTVALFITVIRQIIRHDGLAFSGGLLLTTNMFFIRASREARPYPLAIFFTLLVTYLFLRWVQNPANRRGIFWFVASICAYMTHYATLALIPAQLIYLLVERRNQHIGWNIILQWGVGQSIGIGFVFGWLSTVAGMGSLDWIQPPTWTSIRDTLEILFTGQMFLIDYPSLPVVIVVVVTLIAFSLTLRKSNLSWFWLNMVWIPIAGVFLASVTIKPMYHERYFIPFVVGAIFLLLIGWQSLHMRLAQWPPQVADGIVFLLIGVMIFTGLTDSGLRVYSGKYERFAWRGAFEFVQANAQEGDRIMIRPNDVVLWEHYQTNDTLIPLDTDVLLALRDGQTTLDAQNLDDQRMWMVFPSFDTAYRDFAEQLVPAGHLINPTGVEVFLYMPSRQ